MIRQSPDRTREGLLRPVGGPDRCEARHVAASRHEGPASGRSGASRLARRPRSWPPTSGTAFDASRRPALENLRLLLGQRRRREREADLQDPQERREARRRDDAAARTSWPISACASISPCRSRGTTRTIGPGCRIRSRRSRSARSGVPSGRRRAAFGSSPSATSTSWVSAPRSPRSSSFWRPPRRCGRSGSSGLDDPAERSARAGARWPRLRCRRRPPGRLLHHASTSWTRSARDGRASASCARLDHDERAVGALLELFAVGRAGSPDGAAARARAADPRGDAGGRGEPRARSCGPSTRRPASACAVEFDPTLVRGMGYYTGPIFESRVRRGAGSIAGGGRYDRMVGRCSAVTCRRAASRSGSSAWSGSSRSERRKRDRSAQRVAFLFDRDDPLTDVVAPRRAARLRDGDQRRLADAEAKNSAKQLDDLGGRGIRRVRRASNGPRRRPSQGAGAAAREAGWRRCDSLPHPHVRRAAARARRATVRLSGWIHRKRDHGNLLFLDLRDHYGITQCVLDGVEPALRGGRGAAPRERRHGQRARSCRARPDAVNPKLPTGEVELAVGELDGAVGSRPAAAPGQQRRRVPRGDAPALPLPRPAARALHRNIVLRAASSRRIRRRMIEAGLHRVPDADPHLELAGGRARLPGAEPRAPGQVLRAAAGAAAVQAAPDGGRASTATSRSRPASATRTAAPTARPASSTSSTSRWRSSRRRTSSPRSSRCCTACSRSSPAARAVTPPPFPRIPFDEAMPRYGTDKPDLRNPLRDRRRHRGVPRLGLRGVRDARSRRARWCGRCPAPGARRSRAASSTSSNEWAREQGAPGLGYIVLGRRRRAGARSRSSSTRTRLGRAASRRPGAGDGDAVFFVCDKRGRSPTGWPAGPHAARRGARARRDATRSGSAGSTDFPMYERNEDTGKIEFSHNPFSMPQGGLEALETQDPLTIKAYQYDIVCNGVELSSGAIRNHRPDIMYKAFAIAGYAARGGRGPVRRHAQRVQLRRPPARRLGAGHRPHRHAARRRDEHPRGHRVPDEPAGPGSPDAGARRRCRPSG